MALIDYVIDENEAGCSLFGMVCDYLIVMQLQLGVAYTCNTYAMCLHVVKGKLGASRKIIVLCWLS